MKTDLVPYYRKEWRLGYIPFCKIHNCYLENKCPSYNEPIVYYRQKWNSNFSTCYKCGTDLTSIPPKIIPKIDKSHKTYTHFLKINSPNILNAPKLYLLITNSWFLANFCDISDLFYNQHPITLNPKIKMVWRKSGRGISKLSYFSNVELSYLYYRMSIQFSHLEELLIPYFKIYYRNSKLFHQSGIFFCIEKPCNYQTENFGEFLIHLNSHHPGSKNSIKQKNKSITPKTLKNTSSHKSNKNLQHWIDANYFICDLCEKTFKFETNLKAHVKSHQRSDKYDCPFCNLLFPAKNVLLEHCFSIHADKYKFICEKCGIAYINKISLIKHNRSRHLG